MNNSEKTQDLMNRWDEAVEKLEIDLMRPIRYAKCFRYVVHLDKKSRVLEVGCGEGYGLMNLMTLGFSRLVGVEVSKKRLELARAKLGRRVSIILVSPSGNLPFADESFDIVISAAVIEHTLNPRAFVEEIARVTKRGGYVVISSDCYSWRILQMLGIYRSVQPVDRAIFPLTLLWYFHQARLSLVHCEAFPLPGEEFRFIRLLFKHAVKLIKRGIRKIVPKTILLRLRGNLADSSSLSVSTTQEPNHSRHSIESFIGSWKPRHWIWSFLKLILSDENVFFLVKKGSVPCFL